MSSLCCCDGIYLLKQITEVSFYLERLFKLLVFLLERGEPGVDVRGAGGRHHPPLQLLVLKHTLDTTDSLYPIGDNFSPDFTLDFCEQSQ